MQCNIPLRGSGCLEELFLSIKKYTLKSPLTVCCVVSLLLLLGGRHYLKYQWWCLYHLLRNTELDGSMDWHTVRQLHMFKFCLGNHMAPIVCHCSVSWKPIRSSAVPQFLIMPTVSHFLNIRVDIPYQPLNLNI